MTSASGSSTTVGGGRRRRRRRGRPATRPRSWSSSVGGVVLHRLVVRRVGRRRRGTRAMPVPAGISLPMMMFSLRPSSESAAGLDGGLGEHPGGLLERGRRQPRVGGQRRLGDAHELGTALGRAACPPATSAPVGVGEDLAVDPLAGQEVGVARLLHATRRVICRTISSMCLSWIDTPWSRYTFWTSSTRYCWVSRTPLISSSSFGSRGPSTMRVAGGDLLAVGDLEAGDARDRVDVLGAVVADDGDRPGPCPRPRRCGPRPRCGPGWPCPSGCGPRTARRRGADRRRCRRHRRCHRCGRSAS